MKTKLTALLGLGILTLTTQHTIAGEQRIVGYANGKPLYVSGGPIIRTALPANRPIVVRTPNRVRVNVGSAGCYHGPAAAPNYGYGAAGAGYGWNGGGYYDPSLAYGNGYNYGYGYSHGGQIHPPMRAHCQPYVTPYPAAASHAHSWVPRYGVSSHIPQYK